MDFNGDFELVSLELTSASGVKYNLRWVMLEINVYEDIWNNNTTCDVAINDASNLLMHLPSNGDPIFGHETLLLEFRTPDRKLWSKTFRLVNVTDRTLLRDRELGYILHFVTPEAITNLKTRVSKSYKGKTYSDIVRDIHTNFLNGGAIEIEPTKFQQHYIAPMVYPVQAINWMATHANSMEHEGASYLYYEDKTGYKFVSMESRLAQKSAQTYLFQVANVRKDQIGHKPQDFEENFRAVESYTFDHQSNIMSNMMAGMYGNELLTFSNSRKLWKRYEFDYPTSFDKYKHLHPSNPLISKIKPDLNSKNSHLKLHSTGHDQDNYPTQPDLWIPPRISQLQQLHNVRLTITIPGDSERTIGEVVTFNLPSPEPPIDNKQIDDKFYSGRYLIQNVRHMISATKYTTVLELIKDSVLTQFP